MNNTLAKPKRYAGLDILKTICAFLVVCIHARFPGDFGRYTVAVARVAVPVFLMITGFFYSGTREKGREGKQVVKILKLVLWSSVIFFVMLLGFNAASGKAGQYIAETFTWKKIYEFLVFNASMFSDHLWYLGAILYVLLIVWGLFKAFPNGAKKILYTVTPLLLVGDLLLGKYSLVFFDREFPYLWVRNFLFVGIPYFTLGYFMKEKEDFFRSKSKWLWAVLSVLFVGTTVLERWLLIENGVNATRDHYISSTLLAVALFALFIDSAWNNDGLGLVKRIGREWSTEIYIIHPVFLSILNYLIPKPEKYAAYAWTRPFIVFAITTVMVALYFAIKNKIAKKD